MCAGAISHARIGRLVFGATDEKGGAVVQRTALLRPADLPLAAGGEGGVLGEESAALLGVLPRASLNACSPPIAVSSTKDHTHAL